MHSRQKRVVISIESVLPFRHHMEPLAGIERYARERTNWITIVDPLAAEIRGGNFAGVVGRLSPEVVAAAKFSGAPAVNIWSACADDGVAHVFPDFPAVGRMAAEYLLKKGHRRFAWMAPKNYRGCDWMGEAYESTLKEAGYSCQVLRVAELYDKSLAAWRKFIEQVTDLIHSFEGPTAVFVPTDHTCRQLANVCQQLGSSIPQDVVLLGVNDDHSFCLSPEPALSSVNLNYEKVGYEAAALLDRLMKGDPLPAAPMLIEPLGIVSRASTDVIAIENPTIRDAINFIAERLGERIRVKDVADHVALTVRTLDRHFVQVLGRTVTEEISRQRLERSKQLLLESNKPIKIVARICGFNEPAYFSQAFQRAFGVTPSAFRHRQFQP